MSPVGLEREGPKHLLRRLLDVLAEELDITVLGAGSLTLKSRRMSKGHRTGRVLFHRA